MVFRWTLLMTEFPLTKNKRKQFAKKYLNALSVKSFWDLNAEALAARTPSTMDCISKQRLIWEWIHSFNNTVSVLKSCIVLVIKILVLLNNKLAFWSIFKCHILIKYTCPLANWRFRSENCCQSDGVKTFLFLSTEYRVVL